MARMFRIPGPVAALVILSTPTLAGATASKDDVRFDYSMAEAGVDWLKLVKTGATNEATKAFFMKKVAPTPGCQAIIAHWARFHDDWNNEAFFAFVMEALGKMPSDQPVRKKDGGLRDDADHRHPPRPRPGPGRAS